MTKKTKPGNLIDTVNEIATIAKNRGIAHLFTQDNQLDGRLITIQNKPLINFGSCSYLGLETDQRIKDAGIDAIQRYGSQFSCSRTYVSVTPYAELEELIGKMFNAPFLLSTNSSQGHSAVIPIVVEDEDIVILDHQAHVSMQDATQKLQLRGIPIHMLRHNRLDELETKIQELSYKYDRIWYFIDGVYSMYGDYAPILKIIELLNKYPKLWLYADDAHGMSWAGEYGTGYLKSQISHHPKMILATSLAKGFASAGGVFVFPNADLCQRVKNWGGPLTYSGPQQPAVIGASIASAKIHLSNEIYQRQAALRERIKFCNEALKSYNLPLIAETESPIFFIGLGLTKVGYNMVQRMVNDGFYVNLGIFPAVPETCTGIRFTITMNHTYEDIERLAGRLAYHLPKALKEEERTMEDVHRAFRSITRFSKQEKAEVNTIDLRLFNLTQVSTIQEVPKELWNRLFESKGSFDWNGLSLLEEAYKNNEKREHNWDFQYYIIRDNENKVIAATFFTSALTKEDMFAPSNVSAQIEEKRKLNPYYLTSKAYIMGSLITEGNHLYLDRSNPEWKSALMMLLDAIWKDQDKFKADYLYLRDFHTEDIELRNFFMDQGFVKLNLPDTHMFENFTWNTKEDYLMQLPGKKRNRIKREALKFETCFETVWKQNSSDEEIEYWYRLYENIKNKNLIINAFDIPKKLFYKLANDPSWEIIELKLKPEYDLREKRLPVGIGFIYKSGTSYCPIVIGIDYNYSSYNIYRQMLYQSILRAKSLGMTKIYFGFTATEDKQKFGISPLPKSSYIQMKDNYNMSVIGMMPKVGNKGSASLN